MKRGVALFLCVLLAAPSLARADDVASTCADAANASQPLRRSGHLRAAREQLLRCARDECPDAIRNRCAPWLAEVDAALPSVVFRARDASGADVIGLEVAIDGEPVKSPPGVATALDPGPHHVRYEAPSQAAREEDIVVAQGEKNRVFSFAFPPTVSMVAPPPPIALVRAPLVPPALAYGIGALGVIALGTFTALEFKAHGDNDDLENGCAKTRSCAPSDLDSVRTTGRIAVVVGSLGVATLATSIFFLLWKPRTAM